MSTFGGYMPEFPQIRVDNFRRIEGITPPLACFLTHVHTDHLAGLESLKSPFVYCSAATKELLLRLERYPHRINFELGILESRKQHYRHLKNVLKSLPLETPTCIELSPGNQIQVTLFDANHCTGAVMFLFEGYGKAVLYTGDVRSEPWFVNSIARHPILVEYTSQLKTLDCIYLDTSFTEDISFPTKAEGLQELLQKISQYPKDTVFHFQAWTFGYEEVWMALARALGSQIHIDSYKMRLYQSLRYDAKGPDEKTSSFLARESPLLTGYKFGNTDQAGILTLEKSVRLHSCEKNMKCSGLNKKTVWIRPIITRTASGQDIPEMGIGGGGGDLTQQPDLLLENNTIVDKLLAIFARASPSMAQETYKLLQSGVRSTRKALFLDGMGLDRDENELKLEDLGKTLARHAVEQRRIAKTSTPKKGADLPSTITFPYSRHSSYPELRDLVRIFNPKDVYPCTVDEPNWHEGVSMKTLFGDLCSDKIFRHDHEIREVLASVEEKSQGHTQQSHTTRSMGSSPSPSPSAGGDTQQKPHFQERNGPEADQRTNDHYDHIPRNSIRAQSMRSPLTNPRKRRSDTPSASSTAPVRDIRSRDNHSNGNLGRHKRPRNEGEKLLAGVSESSPVASPQQSKAQSWSRPHSHDTTIVENGSASSSRLSDHEHMFVTDSTSGDSESKRLITRRHQEFTGGSTTRNEMMQDLSSLLTEDREPAQGSTVLSDERQHRHAEGLSSRIESESQPPVSSSMEVEEDRILHDPLFQEVALQCNGDSQSSVIGADRQRTRVEAFLAVTDVDGEGWYDIPLLSTGGNHTVAEAEI